MKTGNKKGSIHIDWVISIGIFLTYIILLITFIKPGYEPGFEGDVLTNLVKKGFHDEVGWNVSKVLLSFRCDTKGVADISLSDYIPEVDGSVKTLLMEKGDDGKNKIAKYKGTLLVDLPNDDYDFWVLYNDKEGYSEYEKNDLVDDGPIDPANCDIGAANPIVFKGINKNKLEGLDVDKISEKFPEFRQFKIRVLNNDGGFKDCFVKGLGKVDEGQCNQAEAPADATVYGVDLGDAILDKNGVFEQVILNIQIW